MSELLSALAKALAEKVDDGIIYGCDNNAIRWHVTQRNQELRHSHHKWIPQFLWKRIIKSILIN